MQWLQGPPQGSSAFLFVEDVRFAKDKETGIKSELGKWCFGVFVWTVLLLVFSGTVRGHRLLGSVKTGSNRRNSFSKSRMSPQDSMRVHKFMNRKEAVKMYAVRLKQTQESLQSDVPAPAPVQKAPAKGRIIHVNDYGADPTGAEDSTEALMAAISDAFSLSTEGHLMPGMADLGGAEIHLQGGNYRLSAPLRMPRTGGGNIVVKPFQEVGRSKWVEM